MRISNGLGRKIREIRGGVTQKDFAKALDVSQGSVAKYEGGKSIPNAAILLAIARIGGITVESLLSDTGGNGACRQDGPVKGEVAALSEDERRLIMAARKLLESEPELWKTIFSLTMTLARLNGGMTS